MSIAPTEGYEYCSARSFRHHPGLAAVLCANCAPHGWMCSDGQTWEGPVQRMKDAKYSTIAAEFMLREVAVPPADFRRFLGGLAQISAD